MTEEIKKNFRSRIEECLLKENGFEEDYPSLDESINSEDDLTELLPVIAEINDELKKKIDGSAEREKQWNENKKAWDAKQQSLLSYAGHLLTRLNIKTVKNGDCKITKTTRNVLKVDTDAIIEGYKHLVGSLAASLPPYIKLTLAVDKKQLADFVKNDQTILNEHPEQVHWEESESVSMK